MSTEDTVPLVERGITGNSITGIDTITNEDLEFACFCSDRDRAKIATVEAWYREKYCSDPEFKEKNFVTRLVYHLHNYYISFNVAADMWLGVGFEIANGRSNGVINAPDHWFIQADRFEDGLMFGILRAYREFGESRKIPYD